MAERGRAVADLSLDPPRAAAREGVPSLVRLARGLLELTKPRITSLVLVTAAAGFLAAGGGLGAAIVHLLGGTALLAGGTNAWNQVLERDPDGRMERTRGRPLPAGRIGVGTAAAFGAALVGGGTAWLWAGTNGLTGLLGLGSALLYAAVYTPLKRRSAVALPVGAVPGALPVLGGWTAARGAVSAEGVALFGLLFLWQMPHFLALGWRLRDQYARAGFQVLAVDDPTGRSSGTAAVLTAVALLPVSLLPFLLGDASAAYALAAAAAGAFYVRRAATFAAARDGDSAVRLFRASLVYLPVVLAALVADGLLMPGASGIEATALADLNASLNAVAAGALLAGFVAVRGGDVERHRSWMLTAAVASSLFLASYLVYHAQVGSVAYEGTGTARTLYLGLLATHVVLAAVVLPLAIVVLARGLSDDRERHARLARWTLPAWLYVSVSGLIVYAVVHGLGA